MDQAQKLLKNQQPAVLKDPFPQGQNAALVSNVAGGIANTPDQIISTWFDPIPCSILGTRTMRWRIQKRVSL